MRITSISPQWQPEASYSSSSAMISEGEKAPEKTSVFKENGDGDQVILSEEAKLDHAEKRELEKMQRRDQEVRQHEQAHIAASGRVSTSGAIYEMEQGPDGKLYVTGGKVNFSAPPARSPKEKLEIAQDLRRMALAPANPSAKDRSVAAKASQEINAARMELLQEEKAEVSQSSTSK